MPHYYVKVMVEFAGEIHADSQKEAEDYAYENWSANAGDQISYNGVYSTDADEIEADGNYLDNCPDDCPDNEAYEKAQEEEEEDESDDDSDSEE